MHGLYLLWWVQEKHLPAALVATVLAAGDVARVGLEIPTGWFADRCGHRASLILGSLIQVCGMLFCWLGTGVPGLVAASLLVALGDGFRSGADHALLYRTCVALGREADFQRIEARTRAIQLTALVALVLTGGAIVQTWGFDAGWLAETGLCTCGVVLAWAMVEPPALNDHRRPGDPGENDEGDRDQTGAAVIGPANGASIIDPLIRLVLPVAFLGATVGALSFFAQTATETQPNRMTVLVAALTLAEATGAMLAARVSSAWRPLLPLLAGLGLAGLALIAAAPAALVAVAIGLAFLLGVAEPIRAARIQRLAADHLRARAASLVAACDMVVSAVALPLAGVLRDRS